MTSDEDVWSLGMAWKEVLDDGVSSDRVPPAWDFDLEFDFDLRCDRGIRGQVGAVEVP